MRNRATTTLHDDDDNAGFLGAWQVDRYPLVRLALLFAVIVAPLGIIGWRIGQLQFDMADNYAAEFSKLREQIEDIPCLDGRILTADGLTAAEDVPGLQVQIHYRWIEEPPDPRWLQQKVNARLSRSERRNAERVQAETETFLIERAQLWKQLCEATGMTETEMAARRLAVQQRVTHMKERVAARRAEAANAPPPPQKPPENWKESVQHWFVTWVAPPEAPKTVEEIILKEELAYYTLIEYPRVEERVLSVRAQLTSHPELYPNLRVAHVTHREYPLGHVAAHAIGYRKSLTQDEWKARQAEFPAGDPLGFQPGDRIGITGIEKYYERHLRCMRGQKKLWLNSQGEVIREEEIRTARPGRDLELTLHYGLQKQAEDLLAAVVDPATTPLPTEPGIEEIVPATKPPQSGCIAVMDVRTGELLVAAAWPTFNIDIYLNGDAAERKKIELDSRKPLYPRLHKMMLPPGSVFKALTATAMLQAGVQPDAPFYCQGYLDTPNKRRCMPFVRSGRSHGEVDLSLALAQSCNVYFFHGAREIGGEALLSTAAQFGFGRRTGIDLPAESTGNLPRLPCDHLGVSIGQATLTVTPLQIVRMMAAIANGGELLTPRLVRRSGSNYVGPEYRDSELAISDARTIPGLSPHHLERVRQGLEQVVALPGGTGYKTVRMKEVRIAGKTGTAESHGGPDHAWFSGYVPAEQPRYAFVVVLERGGAGGKAAGPIARQLVQAMLQEGLIARSQELTQSH